MPINYPSLLEQARANASANLRGELSQDFINQQAQLAAERGAGRGFGASSPNAAAALLRAYGLTSMNLQKQGQDEFANLRAGDLAEEQLAQQGRISERDFGQRKLEFGVTSGQEGTKISNQAAQEAALQRLREKQLAQQALEFQQNYGLNQQKENNALTLGNRQIDASLVGDSPYYSEQGQGILGSLGFGGAGAYNSRPQVYFDEYGRWQTRP